LCYFLDLDASCLLPLHSSTSGAMLF
jgi:hypothetical protein